MHKFFTDLGVFFWKKKFFSWLFFFFFLIEKLSFFTFSGIRNNCPPLRKSTNFQTEGGGAIIVWIRVFNFYFYFTTWLRTFIAALTEKIFRRIFLPPPTPRVSSRIRFSAFPRPPLPGYVVFEWSLTDIIKLRKSCI